MQLAEMTWPQVDALPRSIPVVIPIAALEQHGHHMPVFTDSLLLGEVVKRVSATMGDKVLWLPLTWMGNSHHHIDFPGTVSASPRLYMDLLIDLMENMIHHGFKRIILLNGHGGNIVPAQQATFELRQKLRERNDLLLLSTTYWTLGGEPNKQGAGILQERMGHACEWETSMMLRIRPELVRDHGGVKAVEFGDAFEPAHRAWITKDRSAPGHIGDPSKATAEKGEAIFSTFATDVVNLLERIIRWDGKTWNG